MGAKVVAILWAIANCAPAQADLITFTLNPVGGAISGAPGAVVGWGFTLDNETGNYLLIDDASFFSATAVGNYVPYYIPDVVGPSPYSTIYSASFDPIAMTGTGEYDIDPSAVIGSHWDGTVVLSYDLYSTDPNSDFGAGLISSGNMISAAASIDVTASAPEPDLRWISWMLGLVFVVWRRKSRRFPVIPGRET